MIRFLTFVALVFFTMQTFAQMGVKFEDSPFKDTYTNVRAYEEMGRKFWSGNIVSPETGLITCHTFMDGRLARVAFKRPSGEWTEDAAKNLWGVVLYGDEIESRTSRKDYIFFEGEKGGFMALGKGDSKDFLLFESAELNKLTKRFIAKAVDSKTGTSRNKEDESGLRITFGGNRGFKDSDDRSAFINYNDGTSGRISSKGAVYDMYGQQKGWVNSSGYINYTDGTSGRISPRGAVYNMYGEQTGWARGRSSDE